VEYVPQRENMLVIEKKHIWPMWFKL
jgi:hypothetical protein